MGTRRVTLGIRVAQFLLNFHRPTINLRRKSEPFPNNSNIKHGTNIQKANTTLAQLKKLRYQETNNARQSKSTNKL